MDWMGRKHSTIKAALAPKATGTIDKRKKGLMQTAGNMSPIIEPSVFRYLLTERDQAATSG
eukprot:5063100-Amphidinium_carterae.1